MAGAAPTLLGDRIPAFRGEEAEPEGFPRGKRADHQRQNDAGKKHQDRNGGALGHDPEGGVAEAEATQYPGTISPFLGKVGNGYGLERHIHYFGSLL